jgi:6-pyruvoyltetrahydropterin/6-carboxytetrahydropterin synthase
MAISIWERLQEPILKHLPGANLHRVRVYEMADLFADYYGPAEVRS